MHIAFVQLAGGSWIGLELEDFRAAQRRGALHLQDQQAIAPAAPASTPADDDILKADEAALLLRVSRSTVLRQARAGALPSQRVGRHVRFRRSDLMNGSRSADCSSVRGAQPLE